jgi:hypothetical protein
MTFTLFPLVVLTLTTGVLVQYFFRRRQQRVSKCKRYSGALLSFYRLTKLSAFSTAACQLQGYLIRDHGAWIASSRFFEPMQNHDLWSSSCFIFVRQEVLWSRSFLGRKHMARLNRPILRPSSLLASKVGRNDHCLLLIVLGN